MLQSTVILCTYAILPAFNLVAADVSCERVVDKNCTTAINDQCPNITTFYHFPHVIPHVIPCCCNCLDGTESRGLKDTTCRPRSHYVTPEPQDSSDKPELSDSAAIDDKSPMPTLSPATSGPTLLPTSYESSMPKLFRTRADMISPPPDEDLGQERTGIPTTTTTPKINTNGGFSTLEITLIVALCVGVFCFIVIYGSIICYRRRNRERQNRNNVQDPNDRENNAETAGMLQRSDAENPDIPTNGTMTNGNNSGQQNGGVGRAAQVVTDPQASNDQPRGNKRSLC